MNFAAKFVALIRQQMRPQFAPAHVAAKFIAQIRQYPRRRSHCAVNRPADTAPHSQIRRANSATDGASSPKFSTIWQNALHNPKIHAPLIRQQLRPQFGPAQFLYTTNSAYADRGGERPIS
jgi:hypothetical protein